MGGRELRYMIVCQTCHRVLTQRTVERRPEIDLYGLQGVSTSPSLLSDSKAFLLYSLHCALSLAAQCIVIGPVCLFVCLFVGLLP